MIIEDLLVERQLNGHEARLEMDPLTEEDALQEAQLLDVRFDALRSTAGILFELRTALQLRDSNTGVLVTWGTRELEWSSGDQSPLPRFAWVITASTVERTHRLLKLRLIGPRPQNELRILAESAAFFAGDVQGLGRIPDYVSADESTLRSSLANWTSSFTPARSAFLSSAP